MGEPRKSMPANPPVQRDNAELSEGDAELRDEDWEERSPDTARPEYDTDKFALHVESAKERMTSPPEATFEMLRDSCKGEIAQPVGLDEEQILRPSSRKHKITPPQ
jgi:hypothetical protein